MRWVSHIECVDESARIVLTTHEHEVSFAVGEKFVRGIGLTIDACQYFAIFCAAYIISIHIDLLVHGAASSHDVLVTCVEVLESCGDFCLTIVRPIASSVGVEVLDGVDIIIAYHSEGAFAARVYCAEAIVVYDAVVGASRAVLLDN